MQDLLKRYIMEVVAEVQDPRVPNQLLPKGKKTKDKEEDKEEEYNEMDEMSVAANVAGFTAPLGASNLDMGENPVKPGGKVKKRKKTFARWK